LFVLSTVFSEGWLYYTMYTKIIAVDLKIVKTVHQVENLNHILNLSWCAHMENTIYINKVKFIEKLYKWYDEKKIGCFPKFKKNTWSTEFLKHNSKTHKTREGYYMLNRNVCFNNYILFYTSKKFV